MNVYWIILLVVIRIYIKYLFLNFQIITSNMGDAIKWPHFDEEGYYMSHKSWTGRWQNYWRNNKPSNIKTLYDLFTTKK